MKVLTTIDLLALPSLETPPAGHVGFGAKSDGLYQKIGSTERRLATINDTVASANTAAKLSTARTISLSGDASGSTSFDGSANVSIAVTVVDDSHNHVIANIDGLQAALDGKSPTSHTHTFASLTSKPTTLSGYGITDAVNVSEVVTTATANKILKLNSDAQLPASITGNAATATKLQTARTIWGQSFDGTANVSGALTSVTDITASGTIQGLYGKFTNLSVNYLSKQSSNGLVNSIIYDNGTNVGIGTTSPGVKLDVDGVLRSSATYPQMILQTTDDTKYGELAFKNTTGDTRGYVNYDFSADDMKFRTARTEKMRITSSGNVGIGTTSPAYKLDVSGDGRFTGNVTAPTFIGALTGNANTATKLQTARTIAGVSFDGSANIAIPFANLASKPTTLSGYGITDGVTTNTAQTITGAKTFSTLLTASAGVNTPKVDFGNGFTVEPSGTELVFKYNGVIKQRMLSDGSIVATGELTAYS